MLGPYSDQRRISFNTIQEYLCSACKRALATSLKQYVRITAAVAEQLHIWSSEIGEKQDQHVLKMGRELRAVTPFLSAQPQTRLQKTTLRVRKL
jgi:hypothetical protein